MSKKQFKIKPKAWPKEYTFEEFKRLNPNINENVLINYYNKYLQEYAENYSRHVKHFEDNKKLLSNNQKTFQKHYDTKNRKQFKDNLRISLEWCKNPSNLKDTDKLEEIKIVKANLENFKKQIDHEKFIEKEYFNFLDGLLQNLIKKDKTSII